MSKKKQKSDPRPKRAVTMDAAEWDLLYQATCAYGMQPDWNNADMRKLLDLVDCMDRKRQVPPEKESKELHVRMIAARPQERAVMIRENWLNERNITLSYFPQGNIRVGLETRWDHVLARIVADMMKSLKGGQLPAWGTICKQCGIADLVHAILDKRDADAATAKAKAKEVLEKKESA
jgi:hypothetical protein